eukprot:229367_1
MSQIGTNITTAILVYTIAISLVNCCDSKVRNFVLCLVWIIIWCIILFIGHMFDSIRTMPHIVIPTTRGDDQDEDETNNEDIIITPHGNEHVYL